MISRIQLRKQIPKGYCKVIAEKADVTVGAVSKYFKGDFNSEAIETAALEVAVELQNKKKELLKQLQ